MKCKTFTGSPEMAATLFNIWAKSKVLNRDVIIQTQVTERIEGCESTSPTLMIIVFHPEGSQWDTSEERPHTITVPTETHKTIDEMAQL
jgi:hypothetical protein